MSRPFPARYPGACPACDERIREGDLIRFTEGNYTVHDDCDAIPSRDPLAAAHPVCQVCWLTHPAGACDR
jgi:hypothetical protein